MLATLDQHEPHDAGPKAPGTERFCVVARAVKPIGEMVRFVAGPNGMVTPDIKRKLPGRGVWVTANRTAVADAVKRGAFKRGLKANVNVPADLPDLVDRLLERSALDALAIAHKSGRVVAGFERVDGAITSGTLAALIHAADAAPDGVRKLAAALARTSGTHSGHGRETRHGETPSSRLRGEGRGDPAAGQCPQAPQAPGAGEPSSVEEAQNEGNQQPAIPVIRAFTSSQLDLALGRPHVIHAALLGGREGKTFLARWRTLERYRLNAGRETPNRAGHETVQPAAAPELGTE
jgi:predicted RNA-binding protein YlxR (DUF448 family)